MRSCFTLNSSTSWKNNKHTTDLLLRESTYASQEHDETLLIQALSARERTKHPVPNAGASSSRSSIPVPVLPLKLYVNDDTPPNVSALFY